MHASSGRVSRVCYTHPLHAPDILARVQCQTDTYTVHMRMLSTGRTRILHISVSRARVSSTCVSGARIRFTSVFYFLVFRVYFKRPFFHMAVVCVCCMRLIHVSVTRMCPFFASVTLISCRYPVTVSIWRMPFIYRWVESVERISWTCLLCVLPVTRVRCTCPFHASVFLRHSPVYRVKLK